MNVLLLEDDKFQLLWLTNLFEKAGLPDATLFTTASLAETTELLTTINIDLFLLDLNLPDSDGIDTYRQVRNLSPGSIFIILSSTESKDLACKIISEGAQDYLVKGSFDEVHLHRSIIYAISRQVNHKETVFYAYHDYLTGLPNRMLLEDRLGHHIKDIKRNGGCMALLLIDCDKFKQINDTHGHLVGDEVIKEMCRRLSKIARDSDTVARLGGDEFMIILTHLKKDLDAYVFAGRVLDEMSRPIDLDGIKITTSCSLGITHYSSGVSDAEELMLEADVALYIAKDAGGNRYASFCSKARQKIQKQKFIAQSFDKAIRKKEFYMDYQPIYDLKTGTVDCLEALARWKTAQNTLISPADFIRIAEDTSKMVLLGNYILKKTFDDIFQWKKAGKLNTKIAINLSALQISDRSFFNHLCNILDHTQIDSTLIEFEITETVLLDWDNLTCIENLHKIRALGMKLVLDDFGTGHASLTYLDRLPCYKIKIDRSFISDIGITTKADNIVSSIIAMGKKLGKKIVAEGVETEEQLAFLRAENCDFAQGFLLSRPVAVDQVMDITIRDNPYLVLPDYSAVRQC